MATIKDVAKKAGVSISTVSHVVNHTKKVNEETRRKVEAAIEELDYHSNILAKNLKAQKSMRIGVIVLDMCGLFFPPIIKEICDIANARGYSVAIFNSDGNYELEKAAINDLISSSADGIILSSLVSAQKKEQYAAELKKQLYESGKKIPLVMLERDFSDLGFDSICTNTYEGAVMAMEHLISLGCRKIVHITSRGTKEGRYMAYCNCMSEHGLYYDDSYILQGDFTHESGYVSMRTLMENVPDLDAVFVANDQMAIGALRALREAGISVPEQVKIIGFDNVSMSSFVRPPLSTIHIDKEALGRDSMALLLDRIENGLPKEPYRKVLKSQLIVRASTDKEAIL